MTEHTIKLAALAVSNSLNEVILEASQRKFAEKEAEDGQVPANAQHRQVKLKVA
jgi:hypothetical protein